METYPSGPITPYGIELLREGIEPQITYTSPDGDCAFYINGGLAPWIGVTEGAILGEGMSGLHPIFQHLDQKGARQDGATWADTVYEPSEIQFKITLTARTPDNFRKLVRRWFAAWDPEKRGKLSWVTPDSGEWWCHPRLFRTPPEQIERGYTRTCKQTFTWAIRNDDAFWRSHDSVSQFGFRFTSAEDQFHRDDSGSLGGDWQQTYTGSGSGTCETEDDIFGNDSRGRCRWVPSGTDQRTVVNRWLGRTAQQVVTVNGSPTTWKLDLNGALTNNISHPASASTVQTRLEALAGVGSGNVSVSGSTGGPYTVTFANALGKAKVPDLEGHITAGGSSPYVTVASTIVGAPATSTTDTQVVRVRLGDFFQFPFPDSAFIDLWGRMNTNDASPTGVRLRLGPQSIRLSRFNAGVETVMKEQVLLLLPLWQEEWALCCGTATNARTFTVTRSGIPVLTFNEQGTGSALGANYRNAGFGMEAGDGILSQNVPPSILEFSMGDNGTATQSGYLYLTNTGDQPGHPDLVVYGPGTFKFGNGPDTEPTIEFGPLLEGQVALIKTAPGQKAVYDITSDRTPQDLPVFQDFISRLISFAFNGNIPPLMNWFESLFGIRPEQGNLYRLLKGRWTRSIPPRPVSAPPVTSAISVECVGGNANSRVIASLTPRRRWPE